MKRSRDSGEEADSPLDDVQEVSLRPVSKVIGLDVESLSDEALTATVIQCSMPGHLPGLSFATYNEYETHYNSTHTNRCLECWRNFPTSHYLDLHLAECHNVLVEIRKDKGEAVFACLVETCAEKFQTQKQRQTHLVQSHMFPSNYFFAVTKFGIDKRRSLLRNPKGEKHRNKPRNPNTRPTEDTERLTTAKDAIGIAETAKDAIMADSHDNADSQVAAVDTDMETLTAAMSSMKFVPRTVRFGPKQRAGFARRET